jgi:hypothetical protein
VWFAIALAITYIDRGIGQAARNRHDLGLSSLWALERPRLRGRMPPSKPRCWLGDVSVPALLMRIVVWWSFYTAATAGVGFRRFATRALFGLGEPGAIESHPCVRHLAAGARARAGW